MDRKLVLDIFARDRGAKSSLKDIGDAAEGAGDDLRGMARSTAVLDKQIGETSKTVDTLRKRIAETGDVKLFRDLGRAERDLKKLSGLRDAFAGAGADAAGGFTARFVGRLGPLIGSAPISPPLIAAVAAAGPAVSALVGAAISGGAALGAVGLGAALAARTPEVQAAGKRLGDVLMRSLTADASPMVNPILAGIASIETAFGRLRPTFRQIFSDAAGYVPTLVGALESAANELAGDLAAIVRSAQPVVDVLGAHIPKAAAAVGDALRMMTRDSENSAAALAATFTAVEGVVRLTAGTFSILNKIIPLTSGSLIWLTNTLGGTGDKAEETTFDVQKFVDGLAKTGTQATTTGAQVRSLDQILNDFADAANTAFNAETRFGQAMDEATGKAYRNKAGINSNTEAGRANRDMLGQLAARTREASAAADQQAGGARRAAQIMNQGYAAFMKAAQGMNISKAAAHALARQLGLIPRAITTTHTLIKRTMVQSGRITSQGERVSGPGGSGTSTKFATGGLVTGGVPGRDSVPIMAMPGEGVLSLRGMKALGGVAALNAINNGRMPTRAATAAVHIGQVVLPGVQDPAGFVKALQDYVRHNGPIRGVSFA